MSGLELYRDNVDPEYLAGPKVWNAKSIARFMICMGPTSSVFDICVFLINWYGIFSYFLVRCVLTRAPNRYKYKIRSLDSPFVPLAQTNWFTEGALTQVRFFPAASVHETKKTDCSPLFKIFIIHFLRTGKIPFFQSRASVPVVILTTIIAGIVIGIPYVPKLNSAIGMTPPKPEYYGFLVAMISAYAILVQIVKTIYQHFFREWL